jgi:hypothetical protein
LHSWPTGARTRTYCTAYSTQAELNWSVSETSSTCTPRASAEMLWRAKLEYIGVFSFAKKKIYFHSVTSNI